MDSDSARPARLRFWGISLLALVGVVAICVPWQKQIHFTAQKDSADSESLIHVQGREYRERDGSYIVFPGDDQ